MRLSVLWVLSVRKVWQWARIRSAEERTGAVLCAALPSVADKRACSTLGEGWQVVRGRW